MRIMGIDQAANGWCGYALIEGAGETDDTNSSLLYWDVETYHKVKTKQARLIRFGENFMRLCDAWKPDVVLMEDIRLYNGGMANVHTIVALGMMQGVVLYVKAPHLPLYVVDTSLWKRTVMGAGKKEKSDSIAYVSRRFAMVVDDHQADAICIALYPFCKQDDEIIKTMRKHKGGSHNDTWRRIA